MSTEPKRDRRVAGRLDRPPGPITAAWVRWAPFAVIAIDFVAEITLPRRFASGFLLIAVPVLAAITHRARTVALLLVVSLGLELLFASRFDHLDEIHHVGLYISTLILGLVSIELARQRQRDAHHLVEAKSVAEALQLLLLKPIPTALGPVRAAGYYEAADRRALIGGDLYDLVETPFGVRVVIGDVRGKGLTAIQHVGTVLSSFRDAAFDIPDLPDLAAHMERRLVRDSGANGDAELFVTALFLEFPPDRPEVRIADRGHPAPVLVTYGRAARLATRPGVPLGLGPLAAAPVEVTTHPLGPGEVLMLHTDGVSEARDKDGAFYAAEDRLSLRFGGRSAVDPAAVAAFVRDDLAAFTGDPGDDVAVIALARAD
ncbi:PP2C family protein-serine/threonine phosphatase [Yinghuangia soli]|uniref:Serine/threonine-protein phosphatase n=1 Tax=Yinghuangia soli TaxID=2908204 RepID=A0AA41PU57_9ACTN|nr:PP2C family protein-serine/threonine phosphatase [Yinghuangia soli]MCF2525637.1 serine/threonine-protein phosphatase [Yinghuangia soli]